MGEEFWYLSVLIETMRREGYELQIGQPSGDYQRDFEKKCEPIEELTIDLPEDVSEKLLKWLQPERGDRSDGAKRGENALFVQNTLKRDHWLAKSVADCNSRRGNYESSFHRI